MKIHREIFKKLLFNCFEATIEPIDRVYLKYISDVISSHFYIDVSDLVEGQQICYNSNYCY